VLSPRAKQIVVHTGVYFSMVGLLYAILLAFVVVVAWEQSNAAENATETESRACRT
jgi:hypothetical protein